MDRRDADHDRLVGKMDDVIDAIEARRDGIIPTKRSSATSNLLLICKDILKRERNVTKEGMDRTPLI